MNDAPAATSDERWPERFSAALAERYGEAVLAIVLYGSWLRGKRDTVLDFYVLLDSYAALENPVHGLLNRALPPNVYTITLNAGTAISTAKYATITLAQLETAIAHDFHSYFWARFAQPVTILFAADNAVRARVERVCRGAATRMLNETAPLLGAEFTAAAFWQRALAETYRCELRSEGSGKAAELVANSAAHFERLVAELGPGCGLWPVSSRCWTVADRGTDAVDLQASLRRWRRRRVWGKLLSVLRLFKAAFTFNQALDYILWKVERHSGIREQASALQRRHPLLFAWPVLWRLYRRGGFR